MLSDCLMDLNRWFNKNQIGSEIPIVRPYRFEGLPCTWLAEVQANQLASQGLVIADLDLGLDNSGVLSGYFCTWLQ